MSSTLLTEVPDFPESPVPIDPRLLHLKQIVIDGVAAANSKRNYSQALDHLFAFAAGQPINRELLLAWRAAMESQQSISDSQR